MRLVSLCFHRFASPHNATVGDSLDAIDEGLHWLRRAGFVFADLEGTVLGLLHGRVPERPTVVVTVDDGFADVTTALPVFARHGCPVTVFLATGFLDTRAPLWWDQIQLLLALAPGEARVEQVAGISWAGTWQAPRERIAQGEVLIEMTKRSREPARFQVIEALARSVGSSLPLGETPGYAALRWDDVRALEREGVRFGPHTHTHPILASLDDAQAKLEIDTSWDRLRTELKRPIPIFAYPDGTAWSYTQRDSDLLQKAGLLAAVTMDSRWMIPVDSPIAPYAIGRIGYQALLADLQASVLRLSWRGRPYQSASPYAAR